MTLDIRLILSPSKDENARFMLRQAQHEDGIFSTLLPPPKRSFSFAQAGQRRRK
jgi:hypothetical protein